MGSFFLFLRIYYNGKPINICKFSSSRFYVLLPLLYTEGFYYALL